MSTSESPTYTVVMHTYERPEFVERDAAAGRWADVPLLIADDASSEDAQRRLQAVAERIGARFEARETNGGPAQAAHFGASLCGTPHFMLVGDDDWLRSLPAFAEAATEALADPDTLFVTMPEVRFVIEGRPESVQYDRRVFDGMTAHELLRELVFGGEMRALQAGTMMRTEDALSLFAGGLFRTSEDFVLMTRLCAASPDRVVRVPDEGAYMRREHSRSLSHRANMSTGRAVVNLLALLVGGRLLQGLEEVSDEVLVGLLRQRGKVFSTVYGSGQRSAAVIEALLAGSEPDLTDQESREALSFLLERVEELPRELENLRAGLGRAAELVHSPALPPERLAEAVRLLDTGDTDAAAELIADLPERDPDIAARVLSLQARIAWNRGEANVAVDRLTRALIHDPVHADSLHMLAQIARAADAEDSAQRLENRLLGVIAPELAESLDLSEHPDIRDLRVAFIVSEGLDQFLDDIIRELLPDMDARKFVVTNREGIEQAMSWAEVCWFEWCNDPVIWGSRQDIARQKGVICRLHRYEAFSEMPLKVQWDQVDALVVVADHLADLVADAVAGLRQRTQVRHIPNGVDLSRFALLERKPGFDIALIGYLHGRKNPGLALQIMYRLVQEDPRYRLHVAGKFQDPVLRLYWSHMVNRLGLEDNVVMYEWQDDIAAFLEDKQYLLSTSQHESFGYSIAEAMARGLKPVVHNFPFAEEMWAAEMLFDSIEDAVRLIRSDEYESAAYRRFILEHYSLESQVAAIKDLIERVAAETSGEAEVREVTSVLDLRPQMVNAEMRCRCPSCRQEIVIQQQTIAGHPVARERCPSCTTIVRVGEDAYADALDRYRSEVLRYDLREQTRAIRAVATEWSRNPVWQDVMTVEGIDLGDCMEFELTPHLVQAWLRSESAEKA